VSSRTLDFMADLRGDAKPAIDRAAAPAKRRLVGRCDPWRGGAARPARCQARACTR